MDTSEPAVWRRSQRCDNSSCVEVATLASGVALRDSTLPNGPILQFSKAEWVAFLTEVSVDYRRRQLMI